MRPCNIPRHECLKRLPVVEVVHVYIYIYTYIYIHIYIYICANICVYYVLHLAAQVAECVVSFGYDFLRRYNQLAWLALQEKRPNYKARVSFP